VVLFVIVVAKSASVSAFEESRFCQNLHVLDLIFLRYSFAEVLGVESVGSVRGMMGIAFCLGLLIFRYYFLPEFPGGFLSHCFVGWLAV
jgi:hypothetical protein